MDPSNRRTILFSISLHLHHPSVCIYANSIPCPRHCSPSRPCRCLSALRFWPPSLQHHVAALPPAHASRPHPWQHNDALLISYPPALVALARDTTPKLSRPPVRCSSRHLREGDDTYAVWSKWAHPTIFLEQAASNLRKYSSAGSGSIPPSLNQTLVKTKSLYSIPPHPLTKHILSVCL
jgi:hypothetical protein